MAKEGIVAKIRLRFRVITKSARGLPMHPISSIGTSGLYMSDEQSQ